MDLSRFALAVIASGLVCGCGATKSARFDDLKAQPGKVLVASAGYQVKGSSGFKSAPMPPGYACTAQAMLSYVGAAKLRTTGVPSEALWGDADARAFQAKFESVSKDALKDSIKNGSVLFPEVADILSRRGADLLVVFTGWTALPTRVANATDIQCGAPVDKFGVWSTIPLQTIALMIGASPVGLGSAGSSASVYVIDKSGEVVYYDGFMGKYDITNLDPNTALVTVESLMPKFGK